METILDFNKNHTALLSLSASDPSDLARYSTAWEPFRTVASLYLWEAVNRRYVDTKSREVLTLSVK